MTRYYDDQLVRDIEARLDIVEIVSETVDLTRKGNRYWGLCPFHQEKTSSFSVTPEKNMFYCFGCHVGGDIFSFIMKRDGVGFREAVEFLAARAGVDLPVGGNKKQFDKRQRVFEVNRSAAEFYRQILFNVRDHTAIDYLKNRGVNGEVAKRFQLGFAPREWNSLEEYLVRKGYTRQDLELSGLIKKSRQNNYYDLFRNRIIFPIHYYNGEIVGFGGRVLGDEQPKYLNTPETDIFSKRNNLYGLLQARDDIRSSNEVLLVEGYMDCLKMHQAGITNTVASLGTAFTAQQAKIICRYAENVTILYDGDEAGQRETLRAIEVMKGENLRVSIVSLPGGKDPDEYLESYGKEEFLQYLKNNKISSIEFKINRHLENNKMLQLDSKIRVINAIKGDIQSLKSELEKDYYAKMLARRLMVEENVINRELEKNASYGVNRGIAANKSQRIRDNIKYGNYNIEEKMLAAMLRDPKIHRRIKEEIGIKFFTQPDLRELASLYDQMLEAGEPDLKMLGETAREINLESVFARVMFLIDEETIVNDIEIQGFIKKIFFLQQESRWKRIYKYLNRLSEEGNFDNWLKFILYLDTFLNNTQEGGIK